MQSVPSIFLTMKVGDLYREDDATMYPFSRLSSKYSLRTFCSFGESGYTLLLITFGAFGVSSILWSQGRWGGNWRASCSENTFQCRLKAVGTVSSVLTLVLL